MAVAVAETEAEAAAIVAAAACAQLNVALAFENAQQFFEAASNDVHVTQLEWGGMQKVDTGGGGYGPQ